MKYYLAKFFQYIPQIEGMKVITCIDNFNIVSFTTDTAYATCSATEAYPFHGVTKYITLVELTENEALSASKYYGETRGYRSAYSDIEGLTPDVESLSAGKRKTKVYIHDALLNSDTPVDLTDDVISLHKKALHLHIQQEMEDRQLGLLNLDGSERPKYDATLHAELSAKVESLSSIDDHVLHREDLCGIEMTRDLAIRVGRWDRTTNKRISAVEFGYQF